MWQQLSGEAHVVETLSGDHNLQLKPQIAAAHQGQPCGRLHAHDSFTSMAMHTLASCTVLLIKQSQAGAK